MKIEKRTKGIFRFKTEIGSVVLEEGINELSAEQFAAVSSHPHFKDLCQTSGLKVLSPEAPKAEEAPARRGRPKKEESEGIEITIGAE